MSSRDAKNHPATSKKRTIHYTSDFKGDLRRAKKHQKCDFTKLVAVMKMLEERKTIPASYKDHALQGRYPRKKGSTDCRECHTSNDWLLVYRLVDDTVHFIRTGTHSEIF